MPPRKRARVSQAASPITTSQPATPVPVEDSPSKETADLLNDPWTDEEEIGLFKGLIRCKPTGIHKHFHLMSLHQYLLDNGYIHPRAEHTKPAGIWRKLGTLYNLEALDEREDARQLGKLELDEEEEEESEEDADVYSEAANKIDNEDFELAGPDFEQLKWANRLASEKQRRDESPPVLPELNLADAPPVRFTPSFSIEPEVATPRGRGRAGTGTSTRAKATAAGGRRRSTRQVETVAEDTETVEEEDDEDEAEEEGGGDDGENEETERSTPATATRSTRNRGRPPGTIKARGRGRGR